MRSYGSPLLVFQSLLTNLILHLSGYGLKVIYSLEEYYARNLENYYSAISVGSSHNYYLGRAEADVSHWVEYFWGFIVSSFWIIIRLSSTS